MRPRKLANSSAFSKARRSTGPMSSKCQVNTRGRGAIRKSGSTPCTRTDPEQANRIDPETVGRLSNCGNHSGRARKQLNQLDFLSRQADMFPPNLREFLHLIRGLRRDLDDELGSHPMQTAENEWRAETVGAWRRCVQWHLRRGERLQAMPQA